MKAAPTKELLEVEKKLARCASRLGQKRDQLLRELQRVERDLDALRPIANAVFGQP
jgi:hypothetical protein